DTDGNGSLSRDELKAAGDKHRGKGHNKPDFTKIDADSEGVISKDEAKGRLLKALDKIDTDGNVSLSHDE
ncbi:hypothetical protein V6256_15520, partial [Psychromonas aquatilis]